MSFGSEAVGLARAAIDSEVLGTRFEAPILATTCADA